MQLLKLWWRDRPKNIYPLCYPILNYNQNNCNSVLQLTATVCLACFAVGIIEFHGRSEISTALKTISITAWTIKIAMEADIWSIRMHFNQMSEKKKSNPYKQKFTFPVFAIATVIQGWSEKLHHFSAMRNEGKDTYRLFCSQFTMLW